MIPPETDLVPFDQLEKCRKPDYRHLGGGSRRCDEMSFLLHTSGSVGGLGGRPPRSTRPVSSPSPFPVPWPRRSRQGVPRGARADDVPSSQTVVRPPLPRAKATLVAGRHHSRQHLTFIGTSFPGPATISPARPDHPSSPPAVA